VAVEKLLVDVGPKFLEDVAHTIVQQRTGMVLVVKHRLEANSPARRVDLIIDHGQGSLREGFLAVRRQRDDLERLNRVRLVYIR